MFAEIIIKIFRYFQSINRRIQLWISKKNFISKCIVGSNFSCETYSKCINQTVNRENIQIGNNCEIHGDVIVQENGKVIIGNFTTIRYHSKIFAINRIEIGSYVIISNNVTIYDNNNHPIDPKKRMEMSKSGFYGDLWKARYSQNAPIKINDNVWIGERASILKGVTIGKGSIVGMGAVVTKDIPEYSVVAGNPAKVVKYLKK